MSEDSPESSQLPAGLGGRLVLASADYRRDRSKWLRARRSGLGASEMAAILGLTGEWKTGLDVYLEKTSDAEPEPGPPSEQAHFGNLLEPIVARDTVRRWPELGKLVPTPGLLAHPEQDWMLATIDYGLAPRGKRGAPVTALLEVKTTSDRNYRHKWIDGVPPAGIQVQCQQQMAVTGAELTWVTCWVRDNAQLKDPFPVYRSESVIEQLIHYGGLWWRDYVQARVRPDPRFEDRHKLASLFPADDSAGALIVNEELESALADLLDARRRIKAAELDEERAKFKIQTAMRERTAIATPDGDVLVTWKESTSRRLDQKALAADHPELVAKYKPAKTSRTFLVKDQGEAA